MYQSGKMSECIELQNWSTSPLLCNLAANKGVGTLERVIGQLMSPIKKENCSAKKTLTNKRGGGKSKLSWWWKSCRMCVNLPRDKGTKRKWLGAGRGTLSSRCNNNNIKLEWSSSLNWLCWCWFEQCLNIKTLRTQCSGDWDIYERRPLC